MHRIQVLLADDRPAARRGLRALLGTRPEIEVVGEAKDGQGAVRLVAELQPDVVLMDVSMPVVDGLEATRLLKSQWPHIRVIILTMYELYRADALAAGADLFLLKGCPTQELMAAITGGTRSNPGGLRVPRQAEEGTAGAVPRAAPIWCPG